MIVLNETAHGFLHMRRPFVQFARFGCRQQQRPVLGADGVIGRRHADLTVALDFSAIHISQDLRRAAKAKYLPLGDAFVTVVGNGACAAQDRRDFGQRRNRLRNRSCGNGLAVFGETLFGLADHFDHQLVSRARVFCKT